jgi:glycosyltransferase involved in cell wall biosynthesis
MLHELQPSLLITSNWGSIEWAIANFKPLVRHVHMEDGFGPEERSSQLRRRVLTRRLALRRSTVVLPSHTLQHIARHTWKLNPQQLRYIPNGVDLGSPNAPDAKALPWKNDNLPVIGTVAVLRGEKNIPRLLRAFAKLTIPARLVIVGDGPARQSLEALSQELAVADRVHFVGHVSGPQFLYRHFDLFALSSDTEQMPLSVLEAMAAALPVASTDVGDVRQMLSTENDRFVVPCDDDALATSLGLLLSDAILRQTIGAANQTKARAEYDAEKMFRMHRALWSNAEAKQELLF